MNSLALVILLSAAVADSGHAELTLLDGTAVLGRITSWDQSLITLETPIGSRGVFRPQLLDVRMLHSDVTPDQPRAMWLELIDGTRLRITGFESTTRTALVATPHAARALRLSRSWIRRVDLQSATEAASAVWQQIANRKLAGDVLLVTKRDDEQLDYLSGVIGNVTPEEVGFDWDDQKVAIKRTKVAGISYYHAELPKLSEPICELTLADGSRIPVLALLLDDGRLSIETPAHAKLSVSLDDVVRADYSTGKLAYLSDLKPMQVEWTPRIATPVAASLIAEYGRPRNDVSFSGSALSLAWADESLPTGHELRTYAKGLAIRSRTDLAYRLPAGMRRFTAVAGIDPATAGQGHVLLEIRADDRVLWEGEIDGKRPPVEIDLDLGTVRRLQFHVDYGRNLDYGDRLHLVEARVTK